MGNSLVGWCTEPLSVSLSIPSSGVMEKQFEDLLANATETQEKVLKESHKLLTGYDLVDYVKAYSILDDAYKTTHGDFAITLKSILAEIHRLVYLAIDEYYVNNLNEQAQKSGRFHVRDLDSLRFHWNFDFGTIMQKGGFDVIVGNPPYVFGGGRGISASEKRFFKRKYDSAHRKLNLFSLFIERSVKLLSERGIVGFIVPNTLLRVTSYEDTRVYILENTKILRLVNLEAGVFAGVTAATIVMDLQKEDDSETRDGNPVQILQGMNSSPEEKPQSSFKNDLHIFDLATESPGDELFARIKQGSVPLGSICSHMIFGVVITRNFDQVVSNKQLNKRYKKFLEGKDIGRYRIKFRGKYLLYERSLLHRPRTPDIFEAPEKILVQRISGGRRPLKAAYDNQQFYNKESINNVILKDGQDFDAKYILALLNSKLLSWYYASKFSNRSTLTVNVSKAYLEKLPVKAPTKGENSRIVALVDRMLALNAGTQSREPNGQTRDELEIQRIDDDIDKAVFQLYGLNREEIERITQEVSDTHT